MVISGKAIGGLLLVLVLGAGDAMAQKAGRWAGVGAGIGGIVGLVSGDLGDAVVGAAVGAAAGGVAGSISDRNDQKRAVAETQRRHIGLDLLQAELHHHDVGAVADEPGAHLEEFLGLFDRADWATPMLAMPGGSLGDLAFGVLDHRVGQLPGVATEDGEVAWPQHENIDAVHGRDLVDIFQGCR